MMRLFHATFTEFAESLWLPRIESQLARASQASYIYAWRHYLEPRIGRLAIASYTTPAGVQLFRELSTLGLSRVSLRHLKAVTSGILTHAIRCGMITQNPMTFVEIPRGGSYGAGSRLGGNVCVSAGAHGAHRAYTLEQISRILKTFEIGVPKVALAIAAYAGLRRAEIQGLQWPDYRDGQLYVARAVWRGHLGPTKNAASNAPVPVVPALARTLDQWRLAGPARAMGLPSYILASTGGGPVRLDKLAERTIRPLLDRVGLPWCGWHAFRRGLATNLHELGVQDVLIQAIMRHSTITTTQNIYIQARQEAKSKALREALEGIQ